MKLILAVDAIFPPLTGIGRYAWELALRLPHIQDIEAVRFSSWGRWVDDVRSLGLNKPRTYGREGNLKSYLRHQLARRFWAVDALSAIGPLWLSYRLRPFRDWLYHSPSYFVPPGTGPAVATIHDLSNYRFPEAHPAARVRYFCREFPKTLGRVQHLITDSEAIRREVIDLFGWPEDKITSVPLGVDPAFHPRSVSELRSALGNYGLSPGSYALCVSTLEPRKNIERLLAAYGALPAALRKAWPLVLAGGRGWLSGGIDKQLESGQRLGWVRHLGYVPQEILPALYGGARAFCFPSLYEGFGLPVLEAMACGAPVLTSNTSSLPETSGGAAWLVNPEDINSIREGLISVLADDEWRTEAIKRGRNIAQQMTWNSCVKATFGVYRLVGAG